MGSKRVEAVERALAKLGELYRFRLAVLARERVPIEQVSTDGLLEALELAFVALRVQLTHERELDAVVVELEQPSGD
jgi:hypothetical protein